MFNRVAVKNVPAFFTAAFLRVKLKLSLGTENAVPEFDTVAELDIAVSAVS